MLLKGKPISDKNLQYCVETIEKHKLNPHLYVIMIGNDPASEYYVNSVQKQSVKYNIKLTVAKHQTMTEAELIDTISMLNADDTVHGIMIQKPMPKNFNVSKIEELISPRKDVDGLHALNAGLLLKEKDCHLPCTAQAIIEIMDYYQISAEGKHVVVVGRSNVVGKPIANLLLYKQKGRNATVTVCHSRTPDLKKFTTLADILIVAVGVTKLIKKDMVSVNAIIIDAGINEITDNEGKVIYVGDVDFEECVENCATITPVPGGVGSVTTSILFKHVVEATLYSISR
jgi:methylenetetrahydrofolate dehydrogenase (NADP+)/methenyltetrahydrofolate cyclohydrolase